MDIGKNFWKETSPIYNYVPIELRFTGGEGKEIPNKANGWSQGAVYRKDKNYKYTKTKLVFGNYAASRRCILFPTNCLISVLNSAELLKKSSTASLNLLKVS